MIADKIMDQAGCFENTQALPQRVKDYYLAKASGLKNRLKAERAWFLSEEERRAKPETEQLLSRWGKSCVFLNPVARAFLQTVFSITQPDHRWFLESPFKSYHGKKDASLLTKLMDRQ